MTDKLSNVRTRFAPSPTGFLHLGGIRSALYNWLLARKNDGVYMLRIEDTDQDRLVPEAVAQIKESHDWLGLMPDEITTQSERLGIYAEQAKILVEKNILYPCWCSPERLAQLREEAQALKKPYKYDRYCLTHPGDLAGPHVLRFKIPEQPEQISWEDAVRGPLSMSIHEQDDFVALKSDGYPTYNFANVVDDHLMAISHVLRAEEFLSSTPKHILLYEAFDWTPPVFAHLPQVLGQSGKSKLSKRDGAKSVLEYRDAGYLPDAIINFLAGLGWNEGEGSTKELYTREELISAFTLNRVQKSPAVFDEERLNWLNGRYIRQLGDEQLADLLKPFWQEAGVSTENFQSEYLTAIAGLEKERLKKLSEIGERTGYFFTTPEYEKTLLVWKKSTPEDAKQKLQGVHDLLQQLSDSDLTKENLEIKLKDFIVQNGGDNGSVLWPLRVALTGQEKSPGPFEVAAALALGLGKTELLTRLQTAINKL